MAIDAPFGDDVGTVIGTPVDHGAHTRQGAVGVNSHSVQVRGMAGDVVQGDIIVSNHGDYRVVGILIFDHSRHPVDKLPGLRDVRVQQIDFIAQRPHQQGRVVFMLVQQMLDIPGYAASVGVVQVVRGFVGEPDPEHHRHPAGLGAIQKRTRIAGPPCTDRIGTCFGGTFHISSPAHAFDKIGLTAAVKQIAVVLTGEFNRNGGRMS